MVISLGFHRVRAWVMVRPKHPWVVNWRYRGCGRRVLRRSLFCLVQKSIFKYKEHVHDQNFLIPTEFQVTVRGQVVLSEKFQGAVTHIARVWINRISSSILC